MSMKNCVFTLLCCMPILVSAQQYTQTKNDVRGERYCEVVLSNGWMSFTVYNTMGLNACPSEEWAKLDKSSIKRETGSLTVILNGPRYWTMDSIKNKPLVEQENKSFKGLKMKKVAIINLNPLDFISGLKGYRPHRVERETSFIYEAGKPVYELVNPDGQVYVMQSYSAQKEALTERDLSKLGGKLELPTGWKFKTGILKKRQFVKTKEKEALVLQDNLMNSYQLASHDLL